MPRSDSATSPTSQRPAPLIDGEADLRSYDWFPLQHKRLSRSTFWLTSSPEVKVASVDLWIEAYQQVPAGSLPDDDIALSRVCGFGRDLSGWRAIRDDVMAAWTMCSDGRWYHPTLCEVARDAWEKKADSREAARVRKAAYRAAKRARDGLPPEPAVETAAPPAPEVSHTGQEQGQDTEKDRNPPRAARRTRAKAQQPSGLDLLGDGQAQLDLERALELYQELAEECSLTKVLSFTETRRTKLRSRLKDGGLPVWERALQAIRVSRVLRNNDRGWRPDFDFILQEKSWNRLQEGFYGSDYREGGYEQGTGDRPSAAERRKDERARYLGGVGDAAMAAADLWARRGQS